GAVTQSVTDSTAGRLLKVGDFGLGTALTLTATDNLNDILASGFYFNSTAGNTTGNNYPIGSAGALLSIVRSSTNRSQLFFAYGNGAIYTRSWGPSGWT